ncbi:MAG: response regulator [Epsilonproteobacteria bacterium]|nr:response regulator [Campylobacterota bacterium]
MNNSIYRILIVDDVAENLKLVATILNKVGYQTSVASDGLTALRLAKEIKFDLILLDIMMPIMGGLETCRFLKVEPTSTAVPVIFLTASNDRETLKKAYAVGGVDYIKKPFFKEELLARVHLHLNLRDYEKNLEKKVDEKTKEMSDTQVQLMYTLGAIAEGHSEETHLHVKRVSEFTYLLATLYGLEEEEALILKNASSLHDVGKLGITDNILHKKAKLSGREFAEIKKHTTIGANMLTHSNLPLFKAASIICLQHHEKFDGTGYPKKLKGNAIHLYGRIVAIADVFDALSFKRAYKEAWTQEEVLAYIKSMRSKAFDPVLVDIFFNNIEDFLDIYDMQLIKNSKKEVSNKKINIIMDWLFKGR